MWLTWQQAMQSALYGPAGFYARGERPAWHFRTSVHVSPRYAGALLAVLRAVDTALGQPGRLDVVDIGAGQGELLAALVTLAGTSPGLAGRLAPLAVEVAARPDGLDPRIGWQRDLPASVTGLVIASEWLDNVPLQVAELTPAGPRLLLVETTTGSERPGPPLAAADLAWQRRWWPLRDRGDRAEIGLTRGQAWAAVVGRISRGLAVAADYGHRRADRPRAGTLTGYREGHPVSPVPDGSCDLTAGVALDACADAGWAAGATASLLTSQRLALRALGVTGRRPPPGQAASDPVGYARALCQAGEGAELTDPSGLGGFGWLIQAVGTSIPPAVAGLGRAGGNGQAAGRG